MNFYLMANNSNLSKRVALRQQQELEARRKRNARMLGVGLGVLALVVVVLIMSTKIGRASCRERV